MKLFIFFILMYLGHKQVYSQSFKSGIRVEIDGYLINFNGEIIFQPTEDSLTNFWNSLDNRSFSIWCNDFSNFRCEAIDSIGTLVEAKYKIVQTEP